ncbi:mycothiol synthase [Actinopolyspora erythraea]|uniref:Mycothiol acetyltransferase n=1 Tax=Actinopolyspora erythraea TaxID=414996 RepID=A0A099DBV9_9ACTN|nr:mycothiol synthase [Actinopolyspora erythraea]ASU80441.1 mycothiol synthase [Actinopolyspora erythraea]KGI82890.1 mycothiol acetyltransferase [Actinopolyspora erythraea]
MVHLTWRNGLDEAETAEVFELLAEAERVDGVAPAGEHVAMRLRAHRGVSEQIEPVQADVGGSEHFVVRADGGELAGYAHLDTEGEPEGRPLVAELAVHPRYRGNGVGSQLLRALLERSETLAESDEEDSGRLRVWSHGLLGGAVRLAERFGFTRVRELWRMGREFTGDELDEPVLPEGVTIRGFRVGEDEPELVRVNHLAFSWHPEQGGMTEAELREKEDLDWFDPAGFLLAVDSADRLLGFHWTKIHPDGTGEVYVVGVDPNTQGSGLGRALTLAGLRYLRGVGCPRVMLYVEADNGPAVSVYRRLGFERWDVDAQFGR